MDGKFERRNYLRNDYKAPIVYAHHNSRDYLGAHMYNSSAGGMNFISTRPLLPGTDIWIKIEDYLSNSGTSESKHAEVKWCKNVSSIYASYYGQWEIGVQFRNMTTH